MTVCSGVGSAVPSFQRVTLVLLVASGLAACGNPPYPRGAAEQLFAGSTLPTLSQKVVAGQRINMASISGQEASDSKTDRKSVV